MAQATRDNGKHSERNGKRADEQNPKAAPSTETNQIKNPDDWVSGHEPMTGAQASYLKTLSEQTHEADVYDPDLDKAEASKRIDRLKEERGG